MYFGKKSRYFVISNNVFSLIIIVVNTTPKGRRKLRIQSQPELAAAREVVKKTKVRGLTRNKRADFGSRLSNYEYGKNEKISKNIYTN